MPFAQQGLPRLPITPGGPVESVGNPPIAPKPDLLGVLAASRPAPGEDLMRLFMDSQKSIEKLIATVGAASDPLASSPIEDGESIAEELSDIRDRLREIARRVMESTQGGTQEDAASSGGPIGPEGEGSISF